MAFKIYTKTGDKGSTALLGGIRVSKSNARIHAYGTVDELNAHLGYVADVIGEEEFINRVREIQSALFTMGSHLSLAPQKRGKISLPEFSEKEITKLEESIDKMETYLEPLKNFVLPGGHPTVSAIHIARCVCRRAEREVVYLLENEEDSEENGHLYLQYLNRLSDWLFVLSRFMAKKLNAPEVPWNP